MPVYSDLNSIYNHMKNLLICAILYSCLLHVSNASAQTKSIKGFTESTLIDQLVTETKFDQSLKEENIANNIRILSAKPHHLGSPGDKAVADYILSQFRKFGWDAKIESYKVLFPTPKTRILEMTFPTTYKALLKEPAFSIDSTSGQEGQLPTYNCWSADGDVTAELVFVNYGLVSDYEQLEKMGIDVKGKIVIAKYFGSWRGIKPKLALEHGAIGCIIYSDPKDDGFYQGDVYPKGAYKNEYGVQRGSVMDMVIYPGDPMTPGTGATENATRIERGKEPNLLKIPVMPISYHDAKPLLEALEGPVAPDNWRGALPITYHVGPGKTKVHLKLEFDWKLVPCYDVIATIIGNQYPDEWIIRGNHHDAWVNGANDPVSGQAVLLEEAKAIGELVKTGWKPRRTLVYCAWDGEEPGLLGSTEWVEDHAIELQHKAVTYINSDSNGKGFLFAGGSKSLEPMVTEIAKEVKDPQTQASIYERKKADDIINTPSAKEKDKLLSKYEFNLNALGSGSDYSAFLHHLGIPAINIGFSGEDGGGEYHSIYDNFYDYSHFKDPGFKYGVALSKTAGRIVLRLADADLLPFDFQCLCTILNTYASELFDLIKDTRETTATDNKLIQQNYFGLASDPTKHEITPLPKQEVPFLDFSPLQNALVTLQKSADQLTIKLNNVVNSGKDLQLLNKILYQAEQQLLTSDGLPRRNWYKHSLYAPGFYTGYGVKTMPGVREAIEQRNWKEAQQQINKLGEVIQNLALYFAKASL
jgi:N-acetylated-alpha-linked acidic dipeptidase